MSSPELDPKQDTQNKRAELTEPQLQEYSDVFDMLDLDGSQYIEFDEFSKAIEVLGMKPDKNELGILFNEMDTDNDGRIDFAEFLAIMAIKLQKHDEEEELLTCFRVFDKKKSGAIDKEDFVKTIKCLDSKITDEKIDQMFREADKNDDGKISFEEFRHIMYGGGVPN